MTWGTGTGAGRETGAGTVFSITAWGVADSGVLRCAGGAAGMDGSAGVSVTAGHGNSSCVAARPKRWAVMLPGLRANSPAAAAVAAGSEGAR